MIEVIDFEKYKQDKIDAEEEWQYQMFVEMLKCFISINEIRYDKIFIYFINESFYEIRDENGNKAKDFLGLEDIMLNNMLSEVSIEDGIVSSMLSAPSNTYEIRNSHYLDEKVRNTLELIFEDRVKFK